MGLITRALNGILYLVFQKDDLDTKQDGYVTVSMEGWTQDGRSNDSCIGRPDRLRAGGNVVLDVFEEVKRLLTDGARAEAARVCDATMANGDLEFVWALSFVRAGLCLTADSPNLVGFDEHLQQGMAHVDGGRMIWIRFLVMSMLASQGDEVREYMYNQMTSWAETSPETELVGAPFYAMMYAERGDDKRAYELLKTVARQRLVHIAPIVLQLWPRLLVRLEKWNEQADVRRAVKWFAKAFPETQVRELGRYYIDDGWSNWRGSFFRKAKFFADLARLVLPKDCLEAAEQVYLTDWLAGLGEVVRLAQDERVDRKTRLRVGAWFAADCETIEATRGTSAGITLKGEIDASGDSATGSDCATSVVRHPLMLEGEVNRQFNSLLADEAFQGPLDPAGVRIIRKQYPRLYAMCQERLLATE